MVAEHEIHTELHLGNSKKISVDIDLRLFIRNEVQNALSKSQSTILTQRKSWLLAHTQRKFSGKSVKSEGETRGTHKFKKHM